MFSRLGQALSIFDTDLIVSARKKNTGTDYPPKVENKPCHLTINMNDMVGGVDIGGQQQSPVQIYGTIFTDQSIILDDSDIVIVQKRDKEGNVLATYEGECGIPTVKQCRKECQFKINQVLQVTEPITEKFTVEFDVSDGMGGWYTISDDKYTVKTMTKEDKDIAEFCDLFRTNAKPDGYGGYETILEYQDEYGNWRNDMVTNTFTKKGTAEKFKTLDIFEFDGKAMAEIEWRS